MATLNRPEAVQSSRSLSRPPLVQAQRQQIIGLFMIISAVVLFVAPWIVGYPDTAKDAHRNELAVGIVVLCIAMARFAHNPGKWPDIMMLAVGAWLTASPWALGTQNTEVFDGAHVVGVAVGIVLVVLAIVSLTLLAVAQRRSAQQNDQPPNEQQ